MRLPDLYYWEIEKVNGEIFKQWSPDGQENSWKDIDRYDEIVRVSIIPKIETLPRHDVLIDISKGEKFIKRFGRGFIKNGSGGFKLRNYLNCIQTNKYRLWIFPTGQTLTTRPDYEVRL